MSNAKPHTQRGFSLVETVAALGILALAAVPLVQVTSAATQNTARLETRLLARTVAENVMARAMTDPEVDEIGLFSGQESQLGRTFVWTLQRGPAEEGELQNLQVDVQREGDPQTLARLVTVKAIPKALPAQDTGEIEGDADADEDDKDTPVPVEEEE